jgi:hypothetical protein
MGVRRRDIITVMPSSDESLRVIQAMNSYLSGIDRRDWAQSRAVLCDVLDVAFTGHDVSGVIQVDADKWIGGIRHRMAALITQHLAANPIVTLHDNRANCQIALRAIYISADFRRFEVGGHYDNRLRNSGAGWQIEALALHIDWQEGDPTILPAWNAEIT